MMKPIALIALLFASTINAQEATSELLNPQRKSGILPDPINLELRIGIGEKIDTTAEDITPLKLQGGLFYKLNSQWSIGSKLSIISTTSEKETNRDQDIKDANGKDIRLVERSIKHDYSAASVDLELNRKFDIAKNLTLEPYIFAGYSKGELKSERYDMTDREKPILFSKHNRYYLNSDLDISQNFVGLGLKTGVSGFMQSLDFLILLEGTYRKSTIKSTNESVRIDGETIAFGESDFDFGRNINISEYSVFLGIGIRI